MKLTHVMEVPVISTRHIPQADHDAIVELIRKDEWLGYAASGQDNPPGPIIFIGITKNRKTNPELACLSASTFALFRWAQRRGYCWIRFDGETGDEIEGLRKFDW